MAFNEADTRAKLIDPAIKASGWTEDHIRRETTQPRIDLDAATGRARRRGSGRSDYLLRFRVNPGTQAVALALIEAKAENKLAGHGLEQAKSYRERHNVPFVFSSNGHLFVEYDHFSGLTSAPRPLAEFPTPEALKARYEEGMGFRLDAEIAKPLLTPYKGGEGQRRYYQDAAIRAVLEVIARGRNRALLTLATGTGKTFIATNLLYRIAEAGALRRALFLCDRDELRTQGLSALKGAFGTDAAEVYRTADGRNNAANARVHVATYQTLGIDRDEADASFLSQFYPTDYFSHIVIDECHRSAWGKWFEVLRRNPNAVQIGLTATPRKLEIIEDSEEAKQDERTRANNVAYFGEPVYAYDIAQGIEDGFLAACEIVRRDVVLEDKGHGEIITGLDARDLEDKMLTDARTGAPVGFEEAQSHYDAGSFEAKITLPERTAALCEDLFTCLLSTGGPEQKTIVFCSRDDHAGLVAAELGNRYSRWCAENEQERVADYALKCTAESGGQAMLADFKGAERSHFIACTVDLLTTGVDVPALRNVVFFRYMRSPITFYQMIGRGTRIHEPSGKLMFRAFDYTDATRLLGEDFKSRAATVKEPAGPLPPNGAEEGTEDVRIIAVEGLTAAVVDGGRFVLMNCDGRDVRMPIEEYRATLAAELKAAAPDTMSFRGIWIEPPRRRNLIDQLVARGLSARVLQEVEGMHDYDSFDVLAATAYGETPRTRYDRAARFARDHDGWLKPMPPDGRAAVLALTKQFVVGGTEELETASVLRVPAVARAGGLAALRKVGEPAAVLMATRERLFA